MFIRVNFIGKKIIITLWANCIRYKSDFVNLNKVITMIKRAFRIYDIRYLNWIVAGKMILNGKGDKVQNLCGGRA